MVRNSRMQTGRTLGRSCWEHEDQRCGKRTSYIPCIQCFRKRSCREYTLLRSGESSHVKGWIRGNTKIGQVLDVIVCYQQGRHGVEIKIDSLLRDRTCSWVRKKWIDIESRFCGHCALANSSLDLLPGKRRRTEEKVSILLEPSLFWTSPVFQSNPRTFRRHSRWSYIAKQRTVTGRLRWVNQPRRECSRHALYHSVWIDSGWEKCQERVRSSLQPSTRRASISTKKSIQVYKNTLKNHPN